MNNTMSELEAALRDIVSMFERGYVAGQTRSTGVAFIDGIDKARLALARARDNPAPTWRPIVEGDKLEARVLTELGWASYDVYGNDDSEAWYLCDSTGIPVEDRHSKLIRIHPTMTIDPPTEGGAK